MSKRIRVAMLFVALLVGGLGTVARAQSAEARPSLLVLDLEAKGATALQAEAATLGVVRGLRSLEVFQVLSADDARKLLALERSRQMEGDSAGNAEMSRALGARHSVVGSIVQLLPSTQLQVELRLLDSEKGAVTSQKTFGPAESMQVLAAALPGLAQELVAPLLQAQQGSLMVRSKEEGAEVLVDDVLVSSLPMQKPVLLSRGNHRLVVRKDGFIAQSIPVRIEPDRLTEEDVTLLPSADYAEAWELRHGRLRTGAWLATGLALAAIGGAITLDRQFVEPSYRNQFLPRQLALNQASAAQIEAADLTQRQDATRRACGADPSTCRTELESLAGPLQVQQIIAYSAAGLGLAAAGVASYLWLSGEDPNRYAELVAGISWNDGPGFAMAFTFD